MCEKAKVPAKSRVERSNMKKIHFESPARIGLALILAVAVQITCVQNGMAQESSAITGKISDPSGAAVANATVTGKDVDRGTVWSTKTNTEGVYNLPRLPIGQYELRVEAGGFQKALRPAFSLELNQTARIDIVLTIGALSSTVEVTSAAPLLQTDSAQVGNVMEAHSIASLPLETGNYNQLALLVPGAVTTSPASFNAGQSTFNSGRPQLNGNREQANYYLLDGVDNNEFGDNTWGRVLFRSTTSPASFNAGQSTFNSGRPQLNGNREQANYYLLDGVDNNEFVDNNVAYSPSVEAIAELNIVTNSPSAEYGQFMGGVISASLKSGTNRLNGSAFWTFRRDALNANEWSRNFSSDPTVNGSPVKQKWDLFGGTIGGPIKKDKLFFFADYQGSRFDTPATSNPITTFTTPERTGNFTDLGVALHYPGTTTPMPADLTKAAICGSGQKMGSSPCINGLSATALKILGVLPQASGGALLNNATNTQQTYTHGDQGDLKIDWAPSQNDHLFVRYTQQHVENPTVNRHIGK